MSLESWLEQQGVGISFTAHSARLNVEETPGKPASRSIAIRLQLERREDVRLPDKRTLKDVRWSMYLAEDKDSSGTTERPESLGVLSYLEEHTRDDSIDPEECHIEAMLKPDTFNVLLSAIQAGRFPDCVSVRVRGLTYGWEPDGSGKVWDARGTPHAPVTELSFGVPLTAAGLDSSTDSEEDEAAANLPASSADIRALQQAIGEHIALLRRAVWQALIGIGALIFFVWIFRQH